MFNNRSLGLHMGAVRGRFQTWTGWGKKRNQTGPFGSGSHAISGLGRCSRSCGQWLSGSVMLRPPLPQAWAQPEADYVLMGVDTPGESPLPCTLALQLSCHQGVVSAAGTPSHSSGEWPSPPPMKKPQPVLVMTRSASMAALTFF